MIQTQLQSMYRWDAFVNVDKDDDDEADDDDDDDDDSVTDLVGVIFGDPLLTIRHRRLVVTDDVIGAWWNLSVVTRVSCHEMSS